LERYTREKKYYWHSWCDDFLFFLNDRYYKDNEIRPHYIIQISDLHFAQGASRRGATRLKELIFKQRRSMEPNAEINFVITGDMVDSPNAINHEALREFIGDISRITENEPLIVLGNHDINKKGLAITHHNQKLIACVPSSGQVVKWDDKKLIFLLFNSNIEGKCARGKIGEEQMIRIGNELDRIENTSEYTLIAVLHHHLFLIPEPEWHAKPWYKRLFPAGFLDWALELKDAELFRQWLRQRKIKLVLHGHKHVPLFDDNKINGIRVLGCGSSTGKVQHKTLGMTYLSYNVIGFHNNFITCQQYIEDVWGAGAEPIKTDTFEI
jgi:3',5'-cyclic AMP phosphodiesterase CpdA